MYEMEASSHGANMQSALKGGGINLNIRPTGLRKVSDRTVDSNELAVHATQKSVSQRPEPKAVYSNSPTHKRKSRPPYQGPAPMN